MKRLIGLLGSAMVLVGVILLAYVVVQYRNGSSNGAAGTHRWTAAQRTEGEKLAAQFRHNQAVKVPAGNPRLLAAIGREPALRMIIPKIRLNAPVVDTPPVNGVWEVADWKVGHLSTTPNPGAAGNAAFSAHDDIKGEIFKRIGELKPGDSILLQTAHGSYRYIVTSQTVVDPSDTSPLNATSVPSITLISCTPYWVDTQRLITRAVLKTGSVS